MDTLIACPNSSRQEQYFHRSQLPLVAGSHRALTLAQQQQLYREQTVLHSIQKEQSLFLRYLRCLHTQRALLMHQLGHSHNHLQAEIQAPERRGKDSIPQDWDDNMPMWMRC